MTITERVLEIIDNTKIHERVSYLHGRWQDEREYEDFGQYEDNLTKLLEVEVPDGKVIKVTKRPFGFVMIIEGTKVNFFLKIKGQFNTFRAKFNTK